MKLSRYFLVVLSAVCFSCICMSCESHLNGPEIKAIAKDSVCVLYDQFLQADSLKWRPVAAAGYAEFRSMDTVTNIESTTLLYNGQEIISHSYQCYVGRSWWGNAILKVARVTMDSRDYDLVYWSPTTFICDNRATSPNKDFIVLIDAQTRQRVFSFDGYGSDKVFKLPIINNGRIIVHSYEHCHDYYGTNVTEIGPIGVTRTYEMSYDQCQ